MKDAGYSPRDVRSLVDEAGIARSKFPTLTYEDGRQMIRDVLSSKGPLGQKKLFSRQDVIVAIAPRLSRHEPKLLAQMTAALLADPESIPLVRLAGAKEQIYTTASVLATEDATAESLEHTSSHAQTPHGRSEARRSGLSERQRQRSATLSPPISAMRSQAAVGRDEEQRSS